LLVAAPQRCPGRAARAAPAVALSAAAALSPDVLFGVANAVAMPVYGLMLLAPRSRLVRRPRSASRARASSSSRRAPRPQTQRVVRGSGLWLAMALLYGVLLAQSWRADTLALMFPAAWPPLPRLSAIAAMFERPAAAAAFWVHLLTLDLLVARFVLQDATWRRRAERSAVAPALLACMMFGPTGLLLHALTRRLHKARPRDGEA